MLKPLFDRVIVKMEKMEETTKGGIILTNSAKENNQIASVVEIGFGVSCEGKEVNMYVKKGDKVLINKYTGTEVKHDGENLIIIKQSDILAIVE